MKSVISSKLWINIVVTWRYVAWGSGHTYSFYSNLFQLWLLVGWEYKWFAVNIRLLDGFCENGCENLFIKDLVSLRQKMKWIIYIMNVCQEK